jgi:hypothetical protein
MMSSVCFISVFMICHVVGLVYVPVCICFRTLATFVSKSTIMSLDWVTKNERYFISGNKQGLVRLYDTRDNRITWELGGDVTSPLKDSRSGINVS